MAEGGRERFVGIVCIGLIENQLRNGMAEKGSHTVLVVDDDPGHRGMLEALLGRWGLAVTSAGDGKEAVARVCERPFDVVLMDIRMPDMDGITALKEIRKYNPAVPVVLMTAYSAVESAVEAMKSGAVDYLIKPLDFDQLKSTLFKTLEHSEAVRSGERFPVPVEGIVGNSPAVRRMLEMIHTVAPSEATVLINGKSGTGKELVARAREGDERAFEQLVADNEKRVYNLCRRLAGNPEDGAELAQEAFLNAWRGLPRFQGESSFATWIYRLASNVCIDFLRKEKRRRSLSMTVSLDGEEGERQAELPDERDTPERHLERAELRRAVARGLDRLSPEHRQALVLRELQGFSYAEIGRALGLEEGTVKSRISRARLALRKEMISQGNFFDGTSSTK